MSSGGLFDPAPSQAASESTAAPSFKADPLIPLATSGFPASGPMSTPSVSMAPQSSFCASLNAFGTTGAQPRLEMTKIDETPKFSPDRRKLCCVEGCRSQARAFNRCKRHGGSKRCSHPGCTKSVQSRGLCIRHGGGSRCQEAGCTRAAQSHGKCKMHGGGRPCIVEGCEKKAHLKRLCRKHGGGAKCSLTGCDKWAQRQGMCMTHSKHMSPQTPPANPTARPHRLGPPPPFSLSSPDSSSLI